MFGFLSIFTKSNSPTVTNNQTSQVVENQNWQVIGEDEVIAETNSQKSQVVENQNWQVIGEGEVIAELVGNLRAHGYGIEDHDSHYTISVDDIETRCEILKQCEIWSREKGNIKFHHGDKEVYIHPLNENIDDFKKVAKEQLAKSQIVEKHTPNSPPIDHQNKHGSDPNNPKMAVKVTGNTNAISKMYGEQKNNKIGTFDQMLGKNETTPKLYDSLEDFDNMVNLGIIPNKNNTKKPNSNTSLPEEIIVIAEEPEMNPNTDLNQDNAGGLS